MITEFRELLDNVAERVGWKKGEIRSKMFRHTYVAARLQMLAGGQPPVHGSQEARSRRDVDRTARLHPRWLGAPPELVEYPAFS